jgi:putative glutamine amidotransferase
MAERPRIAIAETGGGFVERCLKGDYYAAVARAGAAPEWVSPSQDADAAHRVVAAYDGFLFPGGSDIDPGLYGQRPSPRCGKPNPLRDRIEPLLLAAALRAKKPVLGICRGCQLINVALGGTLCQDIGADLPGSARRHFRALRLRGTAHSVTIAGGSLLERCIGADRLDVNSIHHQAIATLPDRLAPIAFGEDGIIEGLESRDYPFLLGVQWHPELLAGSRPAQQAIFDAFVKAAGECRAGGRVS